MHQPERWLRRLRRRGAFRWPKIRFFLEKRKQTMEKNRVLAYINGNLEVFECFFCLEFSMIFWVKTNNSEIHNFCLRVGYGLTKI